MARLNKPAPRWAFLRVFRLARPDGTPYLWRLRILQTPWFALYLHRLFSTDPDPDLHDHPYGFVSFVLRGWYVEDVIERREFEQNRRKVRRNVWWVNRKRVGDFHRIVWCSRCPVWTLLFVGPRVCDEWGFLVSNEFVSASAYQGQIQAV